MPILGHDMRNLHRFVAVNEIALGEQYAHCDY